MQMVLSTTFNHPDYLSDNSCDTVIESFEKHISRVDEPIVEEFHVPSRYTGVKLKHTYVPESHRARIRTIVSFVCDQHKMGRSLESLDESHIVFHHDQLKLRGLKFEQSLRVEDRARDFTLLHNLLDNMFDKYNYNNYERPKAVDDLLNDIKECRYILTSFLLLFTIFLHNLEHFQPKYQNSNS